MPHVSETYNLNLEEKSVIEGFILAAKAAENRALGAIAMICKLHSLEGDWNYEGGVLVRPGSKPETSRLEVLKKEG